MQAITIAIGPEGIKYFTQQLVVGEVLTALKGLSPPDRSLTVPDFSGSAGSASWTISNIRINLTGGKLENFSPIYQSVTQQPDGEFKLLLSSSKFNAYYQWKEQYHHHYCSLAGKFVYCNDTDEAPAPFDYRPSFDSLAAYVILKFAFNTTNEDYEVTTDSASATAINPSANIPGNSILQEQDVKCFSSSVSTATSQAISNIDFSSLFSAAVEQTLATIPGSGQLTPDIKYDFSVASGTGENGLTFPNDKGIAIGVTGGVSYKGTIYSGTAPSSLPVPPPPNDGTHHLQIYVSDYEFNALNWAYFEAGLLSVLVKPDDLPDPGVLKVKIYAAAIKALKPYTSFAMWAQVTPKQAPVTTFETVYVFTSAAMTQLQGQLPSNVYNAIQGLDGNAYVAVADLESDLQGANVPQQYYQPIENATRAAGMAVTHDLEFTLTIQNGADPQPNIVFEVQRIDILQNLGLGVNANNAQTLMYTFTPVTFTTNLISTTVPHFDIAHWADDIWPTVGEPNYDTELSKLGKTGVPLPIMEGFQFLFEQAQLSIQPAGYVSVLAQVAYKGGS